MVEMGCLKNDTVKVVKLDEWSKINDNLKETDLSFFGLNVL